MLITNMKGIENQTHHGDRGDLTHINEPEDLEAETIMITRNRTVIKINHRTSDVDRSHLQQIIQKLILTSKFS